MERLRLMLAAQKQSLSTHVFCNVGKILSADVCVYLADKFIKTADANLEVGDVTTNLFGYGEIRPLFMWSKVHVGHLFCLPSSLLIFNKFLLQVHRPTNALIVDPRTDILYKDNMVSVVVSQQNEMVTICPNVPSLLKSVNNESP